MGTDTLICGECQTTFHDINTFLKHKNSNCQQGQNGIVCKVNTSDEAPEHVGQEETVEQVQVIDATDNASQTVLQMVDDTGQHQTVSLQFIYNCNL